MSVKGEKNEPVPEDALSSDGEKSEGGEIQDEAVDNTVRLSHTGDAWFRCINCCRKSTKRQRRHLRMTSSATSVAKARESQQSLQLRNTP